MQTSDYLEQLVQDKSDLVDNLTTQGIADLTGDETFTELVPKVLDISGGGTTEPEEKDVNFYDYDGTRLYSYTKDEFLAMNEFPENPTHEGLTAQGWNWELADAKASVERIGVIDIGQNYITDDNSFRIYIELEDNLHIGIMFDKTASGDDMTNSFEVDWGDNTERTLLQNLADFDTNYTQNYIMAQQHDYQEKGSYVIKVFKINENARNLYIGRQGSFGRTSTLIYGIPLNEYSNNSSYANKNQIYSSYIKKIEFSDFVGINAYSFYYMKNLETITFPNFVGQGSDGNPRFASNYKLKCIVNPKNNLVFSGQGEFGSCYSLKKIILSNKTTMYINGFGNCHSLKRLIVYQGASLSGVNGITEFYIDNKTGTDFLSLMYSFIKNITIAEGIKRFNATNGLAYNELLENIVMPSTLTTLYNNLMEGSYGIKYIDFSKCLQIPTITTSTFPSVANLEQRYNLKYIIVPDDLYEDWLVATNWSNYTNYIIKKSDWEAL